MIIVVEIVSRTGTRACKEYDAPSYNAAIEAVKRELRTYPTFRVQTLGSKTMEQCSENQRKSGDLGPASVVKADRDPDKLSLAGGG